MDLRAERRGFSLGAPRSAKAGSAASYQPRRQFITNRSLAFSDRVRLDWHVGPVGMFKRAGSSARDRIVLARRLAGSDAAQSRPGYVGEKNSLRRLEA